MNEYSQGHPTTVSFRLSKVRTSRSLEMHFKRRYKICICSVTLGELITSLFEIITKGLQYYFLENFRCKLSFYGSKNFSDSFLHRIFEFENFRFPFSYEKLQ